MTNRELLELLRRHYLGHWGAEPFTLQWREGPIRDLPDDFRVLVFRPGKRRFWTYATYGMSLPSSDPSIEIHLFSPIESELNVELLTVVAHYHRTGSPLDIGHIVNFGRPWLTGSVCDHGLISHPYLDGPDLENLATDDGTIRFLWLVPISNSEAAFATQYGLDALERRFEEASFNYLDPNRKPVA